MVVFYPAGNEALLYRKLERTGSGEERLRGLLPASGTLKNIVIFYLDSEGRPD
jgi:hypothetical protein